MTISSLPNRSRVQSIDIFRGLVMVIMALDHARDYFHRTEAMGSALATSPTDLATTTPFLFFTRWITHFCAPVFVFLAGTSVFLMGQKKTKKELSIFLIKRGIWLVLVEILIVSLAWSLNPLYNVLFLQVIWVIGISMILLGVLVYLPVQVILAIGLLIVFGHNILDYPSINANIKGGFWGDLLYFTHFDIYTFAENHSALLIYAIIPWAGIMFLGFGFGLLYRQRVDVLSRKRILVLLGLLTVLLFFVLRYLNIYGDPVPWSVQPRGATFTFLSFFNLNKYPPSLLFVCMTIGPSFLVLAFLESTENRLAGIMNVFGRVPMLYYVAHLYLLRIIGVIFFYLTGFTSKDIHTTNSPFLFRPEEFGFPLWGVYLIWIVVVVILYPLCKKYNRYKSTHRKWWLSYV
jgi:uncharacterized membrane protein